MTLAEIMTAYSLDALRATPAAIARIMLGWKSEPAVSVWASGAQKCGAIIGSIALAIMAGDLARSYAGTIGWASVIVIAVAFNAQHVSSRLIILSSPLLKGIEKRARKTINNRFSDDEPTK